MAERLAQPHDNLFRAVFGAPGGERHLPTAPKPPSDVPSRRPASAALAAYYYATYTANSTVRFSGLQVIVTDYIWERYKHIRVVAT